MAASLEDPLPAILTALRALLAASPGATPAARAPEVAVVCGSGLSRLSEALADALVVPYAALPGFPRAHVAGHASELVFGTLGGRGVVAQRGRFHAYEGWSARQSTLAVRLFAALGVRAVVVTNAAGGVDPAFSVGDVMVISDHISLPSLAGNHPLVGANDARFGERFPAVNGAYHAALQAAAHEAARKRGLSRLMRTGTYMHVSGPSYESPAEIRAMRALGAQAVGMSTAPEVIVAAHCGMAVLGLSLVTNQCLAPGDVRPPPTHEEVLRATENGARDVQAIVEDVVRGLDCAALALPVPRAAKEFAGPDAGARGAPAGILRARLRR